MKIFINETLDEVNSILRRKTVSLKVSQALGVFNCDLSSNLDLLSEVIFSAERMEPLELLEYMYDILIRRILSTVGERDIDILREEARLVASWKNFEGDVRLQISPYIMDIHPEDAEYIENKLIELHVMSRGIGLSGSLELISREENRLIESGIVPLTSKVEAFLIAKKVLSETYEAEEESEPEEFCFILFDSANAAKKHLKKHYDEMRVPLSVRKMISKLGLLGTAVIHCGSGDSYFLKKHLWEIIDPDANSASPLAQRNNSYPKELQLKRQVCRNSSSAIGLCRNGLAKTLLKKRNDYELRLPQLQKEFEVQSWDVGGKRVGLMELERDAGEFGYKTARTAVLPISDGFSLFVKGNLKTLQLLDTHAKSVLVLPFTKQLIMPDELIQHITNMPELMKFKYPIIARSSGRKEDGFVENLAGLYESVTTREGPIVQIVERIFKDFIFKTFCYLRRNVADDGCAICFQEYLNFDKAFVAFSSLFGATIIESVCGGVEAATGVTFSQIDIDSPLGLPDWYSPGNSIVFQVIDDNIDCARTFEDIPAKINYAGEILSEETARREFWLAHTEVIRLDDGRDFRSPLNLGEIKKVTHIVRRLEEKSGYPVDVEGGFVGDDLYLVQKRPIIALAYEDRAEFPVVCATPFPESCLSIGRIDFTGRIIRINRQYLRHELTAQEEQGLALFDEHIFADYVSGNWTASVYWKEEESPKSRVFLHLNGASRMVHNLHYYYPLIKTGRYCYVVAAMIREYVESLEYDVLGDFRISRQKIRVVSDGLFARLYIVQEDISSSGINVQFRFEAKTEIGSASPLARQPRFIINPLLPTHGDILSLAENYMARNRQIFDKNILFILNADAHTDKYHTQKGADATWALRLESKGNVIVIHLPSKFGGPQWHLRAGFKEWLVARYASYKHMIGEVWLTIDYDYFSLSQHNTLDWDAEYSEKIFYYHMSLEEAWEELSILSSFLEDNAILINRVIPAIPSSSYDYLSPPRGSKLYESYVLEYLEWGDAITDMIHRQFSDLARRQKLKMRALLQKAKMEVKSKANLKDKTCLDPSRIVAVVERLNAMRPRSISCGAEVSVNARIVQGANVLNSWGMWSVHVDVSPDIDPIRLLKLIMKWLEVRNKNMWSEVKGMLDELQSDALEAKIEESSLSASPLARSNMPYPRQLESRRVAPWGTSPMGVGACVGGRGSVRKLLPLEILDDRYIRNFLRLKYARP
ncbi:hypothetical protein EPN54_02720 [bacterium]|nr:MAG: hypothetical protein EPN54_02720 [bacterium]